MQLGRQFLPTAAKFDHVFSKNMKRNRVELVSDFPNDAEVISSLQVGILHRSLKSFTSILIHHYFPSTDSSPWLVCIKSKYKL